MKRIAIDISPLHKFNQYRGVGTYVRELYEALQRMPTDYEFQLIESSQSFNADLVHYPFFDFYFHTLPLRKHLPSVVTIHDVVPLIYPDQYPPGIKGRLKFLLQSFSLQSTKAVITDSNTSALDIAQYLKIPTNKIYPIHLAAATYLRPASKNEIHQMRQELKFNKPYLLYVGDINYNKNLPSLIKAFKKYSGSHNLVIVSRAMSQDIPESRHIQATIDYQKLRDSVIILTDVPSTPPEKIISIYGGADWYIQPSLYEGFGFPVLEAMTCGAPVISSNGGSLPEVCGDAALLTPPTVDGLSDQIKFALSLDNQSRLNYISKGFDQVKKFTWNKTAKHTIKVYQSVFDMYE